jgi:hypothetical protein
MVRRTASRMFSWPVSWLSQFGRVRILEVGHVAVRARVQRIDHHLALDRTGDLHAAALQRLRDRGDLPVAVADVLGLRQEVGAFAGIQALGALDAGGQQLLAARLEGAAQLGNEGECLGGQDLFVAGLDLGANLHSGRGGDGHDGLLFSMKTLRYQAEHCAWRLLSRQVYSLMRH